MIKVINGWSSDNDSIQDSKKKIQEWRQSKLLMISDDDNDNDEDEEDENYHQTI